MVAETAAKYADRTTMPGIHEGNDGRIYTVFIDVVATAFWCPNLQAFLETEIIDVFSTINQSKFCRKK